MVLGIFLMLAATITYNVSIILLALAARSESKSQDRKSLTAHVAVRGTGAWSIALGVFGWVLELFALTRISVTLARVIYAAGFGVMLVLARWRLGEKPKRNEAIGISAIALGIVAVSTTIPSVSKTSPGLLGWVILTVVIAPTIFLPDIVQWFRKSPAAYLSAIGAGLGYASSSLYTKGVSDVPLVLVARSPGAARDRRGNHIAGRVLGPDPCPPIGTRHRHRAPRRRIAVDHPNYGGVPVLR